MPSPQAKAWCDKQICVWASDYLKEYVSEGKKPKGQRGAVEGIVATTSFLTISDMATRRRLSPTTKKSLDYVWQQQDEDGSWHKWLKCRWPPYEIDDHFGVTLAGLALSRTPSSYRRTKIAKRAEARLRSYLSDNPPANLHQKGMMLWLAASLEDVVDSKQRQAWVKEARGLQREDGGWRLIDLGDSQWKRPKDAEADLPSDAYATGFVIFALRQAGQAPDDPAMQRGLDWLRAHQRQSGRWFVRSPRRDGKHFISHAATQFAVMALLACDEPASKKRRR